MSDYVAYALLIIDVCIQITYAEAIHGVKRDGWENSMLDAIDFLHNIDTWVIAKIL